MTRANYIQEATAAFNTACPDQDPDLVQLYVLLALVKGRRTMLRDVHDAWSIWRDASNSDHPSLVPFDQLSYDIQELDRKYMDAVHAAAWEIRTARASGA